MDEDYHLKKLPVKRNEKYLILLRTAIVKNKKKRVSVNKNVD